MSHSAEDLREQVARAVAAGHRYILALGGDGTFHHLANVVCRTDVIAGFLPAGNGNDVALALGIPRNALRAAEVFLRSEPLTIDLIRVKFATGRVEHCVCTAGAGLDAEAAHLANTRFRNFPGTARYLRASRRHSADVFQLTCTRT